MAKSIEYLSTPDLIVSTVGCITFIRPYPGGKLASMCQKTELGHERGWIFYNGKDGDPADKLRVEAMRATRGGWVSDSDELRGLLQVAEILGLNARKCNSFGVPFVGKDGPYPVWMLQIVMGPPPSTEDLQAALRSSA